MNKILVAGVVVVSFLLISFTPTRAAESIEKFSQIVKEIEHNEAALKAYGVNRVSSEGFEFKTEDLTAYQHQLKNLVEAFKNIQAGKGAEVKTSFNTIMIRAKDFGDLGQGLEMADSSTLLVRVDEDNVSYLGAGNIAAAGHKVVDTFKRETSSTMWKAWFDINDTKAIEDYLKKNSLLK